MKHDYPIILTINCGSSSIKFALFCIDKSLTRVLEGQIEKIGQPDARLHVKELKPAEVFSRPLQIPDYPTAIKFLMNWLEEQRKNYPFIAVGHRVVHGGSKYSKPEQITSEIVEDLRKLSFYDPEHMPQEILLIEALRQRFPDLLQVACFDTSFHHDLPRVAQILPIPRRYEAQGVRRFGFHGLSYEFLMEELTRLIGEEAAQGRVILAHLGNGASLAAVNKGKSIDTSMGFTPAAGLPMSTRAGDLDPGLNWYFFCNEGLDAKSINELVNFQSGLLGVSETSSDMQKLLKIESKDVRAADAVALFCYTVKKWIGAYAAALGGLDILVFSGGIGENSSSIRSRICSGLEFLGIAIDENQNETNSGLISVGSGRVAVYVIPADEQCMIAKGLCSILKKYLKET